MGANGRIDLVSVKARVFAGLAPSEAVPGLRAYLVRLLGSDAHAEIDRAGTEVDWLRGLASLDDKGLTLSAADRRWYHLTADPAGVVVTIFDVTSMKRRELLLTELHERLAGEGQNLKRFAQDLAVARSAAAEALRRQEQANLALEREIAERRQLETELRRLADTDPLTDSLNRRRFLEIVNQQIKRSHAAGLRLTILMLDLDHFKRINDRFGHSVGDRALIHFAQSVRGVLRTPAVLGRLGGEEFAVLLPNCDLKAAIGVARRLKRTVTTPLRLDGDGDGAEVVLSVSIGVAVLADAEADAEPVMKRADKALYLAKDTGRDRIAWMTEDARTGIVDETADQTG